MSTSKPIHIGPDMRITHPEYGDMTEDVARELQLLNQKAADEAYLEVDKRQRHIAAVCGTEQLRAGGIRHVAQIDEDVFNYWEAREGREFWTHELDYMLKKHPELAVKSVRANPMVGYTGGVGNRIRGKRGRWAA